MSAEDTAANEQIATKDHRDKLILDALIVVIGFGLCRSWIVFCLAAPLHQVSLYATKWTFLIAGALTALFVAILVKHFHESLEQNRRSFFWATGISLTLSAFVIPFATSQGIELLLFAGFIIGGAGAGLLQVLWGERFAAYRIRFATVVAPAAAIVTALLVSVSSPQASFIGYIVFPLLSFFLLVVIAERTGVKATSIFFPPSKDSTSPKTLSEKEILPEASRERSLNTPHKMKSSTQAKEKRPSLGSDVIKLMFSIMTFSFLCRVFDSIPLTGPDPFAFFGGGPLMALVVVGIAFLLLAAILKGRFNATLTYRLSLPIMVAGFVAIALFFDTHAAVSIFLVNIGYEFFDILAWILFTEIAHRKDAQPLQIFGIGVASMFTGMAIGLIGGEILNGLILGGSIQVTVIAMLSILGLVIVAFLVIPEGTVDHLATAIRPDKKESSEKRTEENTSEGRLEGSCSCVAQEYQLTPRESEVLVLLAYGRTLSIISRDLHIAKGTARTHIENIYRKLDVHKQQELIDLVENFEP